MKKILLIILVGMSCILNATAQKVTVAEKQAANITGKMQKDLRLTNEQQVQVYKVHMILMEQKQQVWQKAKELSEKDLDRKMQAVENKRDSMYQKVLDKEQFVLYKQRKTYFIYNNNQ